MNNKLKIIITFLAILQLATCIDPYVPKLAGYNSLLVVDGLLTNENSAYTVRLSRTFQEHDSTPVRVSDATLYLTDDNGNTSYFINLENGIYKTDSIDFRGVVGRTYVLHILTKENEEYESDPGLMLPVPDIDNIHFGRDQQLINNSTQNQDGVSFYLDSKWGDNNEYYRWSFDETWEFRVPFPKKFDFLFMWDGHDHGEVIPTAPRLIPVSQIKEYCWKTNQSNDIIIRSDLNGQKGSFQNQPINFIASDKSDRLSLKYSILVKQYSISKEEYQFWNNLNKISVEGGDIFARQPFAVTSNIHNIKNPDERVLGYFKVSAVTQKRKNITISDIAKLSVPAFHQSCVIMDKEPLDFETRCQCPPKTWDDVYWYMTIASNYAFVQPYYNPATHDLVKMEFTTQECADCELTGTSKKPDFWDEFN